MILSCTNITKEFGETQLIKSCSFSIDDLDHISIVGANGAGKTTLLKIILDLIKPTSGTVTINKDKTIGYLSQKEPVNSEKTLYEELLSTKQYIIDMENSLRDLEKKMPLLSGELLKKCMESYSLLSTRFELDGGYLYMSEVIGVLNGLGFLKTDYERKINTFSGGQKTRIALAKILLKNPDLIILDEPTNHLDLNSVAWLETYLLNYKGALLVVSHDRYFLDKISNKILEIEQTNTRLFTGNYSEYAKKKEQIRDAEINAYINNKKERKRQEEVIEKLRSFNREKSIKRAESREKLLDKMDVIDKPLEDQNAIQMILTPKVLSGKDVLSINELSKTFKQNVLFKNLNFDIKRGEHIAILGDNGTGKTTILKILNKQINATSGDFKLGVNVEIGYYDQEQQLLDDSLSLFDDVSNTFPHLTITEIRNTLAAFSFTGDEVMKKINTLSGGERGRLSLAKLMLSNANFLILDEPTNHLDIPSKEILESAINGYKGTVLYVSHDRYFIRKTATRILELHNKKIDNYIGGYSYYLEQKERKKNMEETKKNNIENNSNDSIIEITAKNDWNKMKEEAAKERKLINEINQTEHLIEKLETKKEELETKMEMPTYCTNSSKLQELSKKLGKCIVELENAIDLWSSLQEKF